MSETSDSSGRRWGYEDYRPALEASRDRDRPESIDKLDHAGLRNALQVVGPVIVLIGMVLSAIGFVNFFSSVNNNFGGPPRYFWCAFIGLPMIGLGGSLCKFAYMRAVTRYMADEVAPVGKDVVNYMADGTQDAVRTIATAVSDAIRSGAAPEDAAAVRCRSCHAENDASANFCKACGQPLTRSIPCHSCGEQNDADAQFCNRCGKALGSVS